MDNYLHKPIAVIGAGSIGERYIRLLYNLGFNNIVVYRRSEKPFKSIGEAEVKVVYTFEELLAESIVCAIIATPTHLHLEQAVFFAEKGIHILVEKPLSNTLEGIQLLKNIVKKNNVFILVGYMMRFHPLICDLKEIISNEYYGKLISIQSKWAEYLPDWHPWEDYRISYASNKKMGGGVALTLSHDIDLAFFLTSSKLQNFSIFKNYCPSLNIDVESSADIILEFNNKIIANIHLNFFEIIKERYTKLCFEKGTIVFDYFNNKYFVKSKEDQIEKLLNDFQRDDLFTSQIRYFFSILTNNTDYTQFSSENINTSESIIKICLNE